MTDNTKRAHRRTNASARNAGRVFNREIADLLAGHIDDRIDKRVLTGKQDKGDIVAMRVNNHRVVVECKNVSKLELAGWVKEAEVERLNDHALVGIVIHKRHGVGDPLQQYVTMTTADLIALITGRRPEALTSDDAA